jgi:hypothetical protein
MSEKTDSSNNHSRLDKKFDFLVEEYNKKDIENTKYFEELDSILQNKFKFLIVKVNNKIFEKCKEQIESLALYSDTHPSQLQSQKGETINNLKPLRGHETEFKEARNNYIECSAQYEYFQKDIDDTSISISDMSTLAKNICLERCRSDLKAMKSSENEVRNCLQTCYRYDKYNMQAFFNIIQARIHENENLIDKI